MMHPVQDSIDNIQEKILADGETVEGKALVLSVLVLIQQVHDLGQTIDFRLQQRAMPERKETRISLWTRLLKALTATRLRLRGIRVPVVPEDGGGGLY